ncbi:MAG: alpha-mannosidase [Acidobacteriaceae bacterium]
MAYRTGTISLRLLAPLFAGAVLFASAHAQTTPKPEPLHLSQKSEQVLTTLSHIHDLPVTGWRMHEGNLMHGESVDLDDSSWAVAKENSTLGKDAIWFRKTIVIPQNLDGYDLTGTRISFAFNIGANGPVPLIVYFDGRRVAMGDDLEPIQLFDHAKPGDKVVVAVKALYTVDQKRYRGATAKIFFSAARPNPNDVRLEAISASYLIPVLDKNPAADQNILDKAVSSVDIDALKQGNQQAFDASLKSAQQQLEALRPTLSKASFLLAGNSHIDAAWLWPWTETVDTVKRTFFTALQLMQEYPNYTFSQSAAAYTEWMADKYPEINNQIRERVKQGRWEIVGGMWIEPDLNMPDGESLVRQILVGKRYFKQQYGVDVRIGWNPDSFGYNWQLPQIYKKSGIDYFVTQKMEWNDTNQLPLKLFWWQSPDGSRVLTYFPHGYGSPIEPDHIASDFYVARKDNPGLPEMMHLYGIGDHGGGPTRAMLDVGDRWAMTGGGAKKVFPPTRFGIAQTFFSSVEKKLDTKDAPVWNYETLAEDKGILPTPPPGKISLPVWNDELYLEYHRGVFTTQANHKRNIRESSEWLLDAEKWSSLDWLAGASYPGNELNEAWKKVLFNQFHDLAAGSGIAIIYKDAQKDYNMVHFTANQVQGHALGDIASYIDTTKHVPAKGVPIIVWNPMAWTRTDIVSAHVELPDGIAPIQIVDGVGDILPSQPVNDASNKPTEKILFLAKDVPALGYRVFYARPVTAAAKQKELAASTVKIDAGSHTLENAFLKLTIDPATGCITHLVDKKSGFDSIAAGGCGNELQTFVDKPKEYDAWNIDPGTLDHYTPIHSVESVKFLEAGPLYSVVSIKRHWQGSEFDQKVILYNGLDRVDVVNNFDWHEKHVLLKAAFPLAATSNEATYEIPFGSIERPTTRNNSWEDAKFEVPAQRWADLGNSSHGFSLINDSKYGYDDKGNMLRLSLLRSPTWPDPNADQGHHHFAYSLYPHAGSWKQALTVRQGFDFNYKLEAEQVAPHTGVLPTEFSFVKVQPEDLVLTAVKKTEDGNGLLLRFYEWAGKAGKATITLPNGVASAVETNLMETPEGNPLATTSNSVTVPFMPYSINTVRVSFGDRGPGFFAGVAKK